MMQRVHGVRATVGCQPVAKTPGAERVHIWFDLGGVLIGAPKTGGMGSRAEPLQFMPGALAYLHQLEQAGYSIGAITNIPQSWGKPGDYASKLQALKDYVAKNWCDPAHPFDWSIFDRVLLPLWDKQRKPAPKLFRDARLLSSAEGKIGLYEGETHSEIVASRANGVPAFQVKYDATGRPVFLPEKNVLGFIEKTTPASRLPARRLPPGR